jgi:hypothetical protein
LEEEHENINEDGDTNYINPHGIDLDALSVECHPGSEIAWLRLKGLTAREALGLSFKLNFAHICQLMPEA